VHPFVIIEVKKRVKGYFMVFNAFIQLIFQRLCHWISNSLLEVRYWFWTWHCELELQTGWRGLPSLDNLLIDQLNFTGINIKTRFIRYSLMVSMSFKGWKKGLCFFSYCHCKLSKLICSQLSNPFLWRPNLFPPVQTIILTLIYLFLYK